MRCCALLALVSIATLSTSTALVEVGRRTTVGVEAVAYDYRTSDPGCSPDGCIAENTRDGILNSNSRWSCKVNLIEGNGGCRIIYTFEEPQDIVKMRIAFHKGNENVLSLNVIVDGELHSTIESSGETNGFQNFYLNTEGTSEVKLYHADYGQLDPDTWVSIKEVKFLVE